MPNVTVQGASFPDVPSILLPTTPTTLIPERSVACTSSFGGGFYGIAAGVANYLHEAVTATINGVTYVLPFDPDPNGYAEGYLGYGAPFASSTAIDFSTYAYRVEQEDDLGNWRLYVTTSGTYTITAETKDRSSFVNVEATTAGAADVTQGKIFYTADGTMTQGTAQTGVHTLAIRPDATLEKSYTFDQYVVDDLEITIPAYSTSAQTLRTTQTLSPTVTMDYSNDWYIVIRALTIPEYNTETKQKGRPEYVFSVAAYEFLTYAANTFQAGGKTYASRSSAITAAGAANRILYWSSATAISTNASATYGPYQTIQAPTASGTTLTLKSPVIGIRGSTTYLTSAVWSTITDIRVQYVIEVWKAPHITDPFGWVELANSMHIIECAQSASRTLT